MEVVASSSSVKPVANTDVIADRRFAEQLRAIERLKQFLFDENVLIPPERLASLDFGPLNNLKHGTGGRSPTESEWRTLDTMLSGLVSFLTPELRWKLRVKQLGFYFRQMPLIALGIAVLATTYYVMFPSFITNDQSLGYLASYWGSLVVWTISQGILGACAFLGVSVVTARTARQGTTSDPLGLSIDITDQNILTIRIILGAMFAFLIGLPLSYEGLTTIIKSLWPSAPTPGAATGSTSISLSDYVFLLAPFMFGFSTSLVLGVLNRIVRAINTLLGISSETQS